MNFVPPRRSERTIQHARFKQPCSKDRLFRILSIDGGGIRGVFPAAYLAEIERRFLGGQSIASYFDMIAGTSTRFVATKPSPVVAVRHMRASVSGRLVRHLSGYGAEGSASHIARRTCSAGISGRSSVAVGPNKGRTSCRACANTRVRSGSETSCASSASRNHTKTHSRPPVPMIRGYARTPA
ncbi:patatin-like phospholipase [Mesorhizobium tianshanense]|uniref:Patatin-like phospholipase n=1 Tax=Mesorhizobium tianshanense TaxID=39844 RepID=A0A562NBT0_9HYPH|nr:patatin-like phospholipase [Mesorhizobium tianshanense]